MIETTAVDDYRYEDEIRYAVGWVCPRCERVWAPWLEECKVCNAMRPNPPISTAIMGPMEYKEEV